MDIVEASRRSGLPASTLRYYEEQGLIESAGRRGLRRTYDGGILERLALISLGRAVGFSLEEVGRMLLPDGKMRIDRKALAAKADELDGAIRELTAMRDGLRHAAICPVRNHMDCPKFRRILKMSASGLIHADSSATSRKRPNRKQPEPAG